MPASRDSDAKLSLDQIRSYWTEQAQAHGGSHEASWSDRPVIEMEIRKLLEYLADDDRVLDIGCANGWSTFHWAASRKLHVRGLDYIPEMIEEAKARLLEVAPSLQGDAEFAVGDITELDEPDDSYDKVVVVRVVINLASWETQRRALLECARVVKPGGLLLLSEATVQGSDKLNAFRAEWDLPPIPMPSFNRYLDQDQVVEAVSDQLELVELSNFASSYYVGSRVLKPLLIQALGSGQDLADPNMELNAWISQLPAAGDYGTQKLFVFRKR